MPMSPIAGTRSSKPSSPTSSTDPWRTCRRGASGRTPRGCSARRSPTISCPPPAFLQVVRLFAPVDDATTHDRQYPGPIVSTATRTDLATTHAPALVGRMASIVGQNHRPQSASYRLNTDRPAETARPGPHRGKLGRPAVTACPQLPIHPLARPERASASRRWIQA